MYYMVTGIIPDDSVNRFMDDKLLPLERIDGTKLDRHAIDCITKGLAVRIEDRYPSVALLYADLYGRSTPDDETFPGASSERSPAVSNPIETNFTEKLLEELIHSRKKYRSGLSYRKAALSLLISALLVLCIALGYHRHTPAHTPVSDRKSTTLSPVPEAPANTTFRHSPAPKARKTPVSAPSAKPRSQGKTTFRHSPTPNARKAPVSAPSAKPRSQGNTTFTHSPDARKPQSNSSATGNSSSSQNTQHFDGDLDGL